VAEGVCDDSRVQKRVLIVDDHQPFRAVARALLEGAGYIVAGEAADAAEALAAVAAHAPDAVLLDVQLPDRDGFAVATELAAADGPAVVLVSSRDAVDYGRRVATCGARGFISKSKLSAAAVAALLE
jgi:DNA-binding NarL/FixJ family response regulator